MNKYDNLNLKSIFRSDGIPLGIVYIDIEEINGKQYFLVDEYGYKQTHAIADIWPRLHDKFIENNIDPKIRTCDIFNLLPIYYFDNKRISINTDAFGYNYYIEEENNNKFSIDVNIEFLDNLGGFDFMLNCYDGIGFKHKEEYEQALVIKQLMGFK